MTTHLIMFALVAALAAPTPALAQQNPFGGFLQQLVPGGGQPRLQERQQPAAPVSRMQAQTAPRGGLGTDAVAVVEEIDGAPNAGLQFMDYVFAEQAIALGPRGRLVLSHLSGCLVEEIEGGSVTVDPSGSRVSGGRLRVRPAGNCRVATPVVAAVATEAGATVNRVSPFVAQNWFERTVKRDRPVFKWNGVGRALAVRVVDLDRQPASVVWQATSSAGFVEYPASAPALAVGMPYRVEVVDGAQVLFAAAFSIDPGLEVPDTLANRVVPVASR
jgi:hypothetical protein